jgi:hypothetical protein
MEPVSLHEAAERLTAPVGRLLSPWRLIAARPISRLAEAV